MKRYPKYKDSGIDWLGEIPEEWKPSTIRGVTKSVTRRNRSDLPLLAVYRDYGVILRDSRDDNHNRIPEDLSNYKVVKPGNLVLNKMKTWQGSLGVSEYEGIVSPAYIICDVYQDINAGFFHYLLRCYRYIFIYNKISYGVRVDQWDMHYEDFKQIPIFLPPLCEQKTIACFIDRKLVQIDQFISNKQRFIELLKEQKRAIINRAVTKGLNPDAPMKPSGIEWLGDIPQGWEVRNVRSIVNSHKQGFYTNEGYVDEGTPLLRITDINENSEIDFSKCPNLKISPKEQELFNLNIGDFVFVRSGATIGKFGVIKQDTNAIFGSYLIRFRFAESQNQDYLKYFFISTFFRDFLFNSIHGGANVNINAENIKNQKILILPLEEQEVISKFLNKESAQIDLAITKAEKEIELIQEYRTTLISDAVTGKIDVREFTHSS